MLCKKQKRNPKIIKLLGAKIKLDVYWRVGGDDKEGEKDKDANFYTLKHMTISTHLRTFCTLPAFFFNFDKKVGVTPNQISISSSKLVLNALRFFVLFLGMPLVKSNE